jgi:MFS family permease
LGLGVGAEAEYVSYATSRYYRAERLSKSLGAIWIFFAWGAGAGVLVGSASYDLYGSYMNALYVFAALALLAVIVVLTLGSYRVESHASVRRPKLQAKPAA